MNILQTVLDHNILCSKFNEEICQICLDKIEYLVNQKTLSVIEAHFQEGRKPLMGTRKPEKKKKKVTARKPVPKLMAIRPRKKLPNRQRRKWFRSL